MSAVPERLECETTEQAGRAALREVRQQRPRPWWVGAAEVDFPVGFVCEALGRLSRSLLNCIGVHRLDRIVAGNELAADSQYEGVVE